MKNFISILIILFFACNNEVATSIESAKEVNASASNNCGNNLWFTRGAKIHTSSFDGQGNETARQVTTVAKVFTQGNMTIAELEMKNTDQQGGNETVMNASYKCDGKLLYMDLSGLLQGRMQGSDIETSGLPFPLDVAVGDTLADADYTIVMRTDGNTRKIKSYIRERKVESKETITTAAGKFDCYKIASVIETETDMPGLDEKRKKAMEEMKKKMGKNKMTFWFAPDVTVIKTEFHMGDKLITRSEVTAIKK